MKRPDIDCYRINYDKDEWRKLTEDGSKLLLPYGAALAVNHLCDYIEYLESVHGITENSRNLIDNRSENEIK